MTILHQYTCELEIKMPHLAFRQGTEIHMQKMLARRIDRTRTVDCLPLWFYFYIEPIRDPLTIIQHADLDVELHPGNNRFIGRSIRGDAPWAAARIITIQHPWRQGLSGIRNETLLDTLELDYQGKHDFYANQQLNTWCFGSYAPTHNSWLSTDSTVVAQWLGEWGGTLRLHNGKVHRVNQSARHTIDVDVKDHTGLMAAVKHLFAQLELKMPTRNPKQLAKQAKRHLKSLTSAKRPR